MNKLVLLITLFLFENTLGQTFPHDAVPNRNVYENIYKIKYKNNTGTCVLVNYDSLSFFITAKHIFEDDSTKIKNGNSNVEFEIFQDSIWKKLNLELLIHEDPNIDLVALKLDKFIPTGLRPESDFIIGSEVYFLGYPLNLESSNSARINRGFPIALLRKGVLSGQITIKGKVYVLVDAKNNSGFSGGPVIYSPTNYFKDWVVIGIVSGRIPEEFKLDSNISFLNDAGFTFCTSIGYLSQIIEKKQNK